MSDTPQGPDWWQASDDKWYPPPRPEMPGQVTTVPLQQPPAGPPIAPPGGPPIGPPPGAPPSGGFTPGGPPSPYAGMPPAGQPPAQQNKTPLYVAIGVVVAAALVGLIVVLTSGDDEPTAPPPDPPTTQAPPTSAGTEPPDTTDSSDEPPPSGDGTVEVVESGFSNFTAGVEGNEKTGSYGFIVENTGDEIATDVQISVSAFAADGTALASVSHTVYVLRPGEKLGIGDEFYGENFPAEIAELQVDVGEPSDYGAEEVPEEGTLTAEGITTTSDEYGLETTFTARSTYAEQVDSPMAYAIYRDASGKIIGGSYDYLDFIPPNGSVAASVQSYELIPNVGSTEIYIDSGYWY
jgi:hypothetical protein